MGIIPEGVGEGPSAGFLVRVGLLCLLVAGGLIWTWRDRFFDHWTWTPASTEVLEIMYPLTPAMEAVVLPPEAWPPTGGLLLRWPEKANAAAESSAEEQAE